MPLNRPNEAAANPECFITLYYNHNGNLLLTRPTSTNLQYFTVFHLTTSDHPKIATYLEELISDNSSQIYSSRKMCQELSLLNELEDWYILRIYRDIQGKWHTPFPHHYTEHRSQDLSKLIARDLQRFIKQLKQRCDYRNILGNYSTILQTYQKIYQDHDPDYYHALNELSAIIEQEQYLLLSDHEEIRKAYIHCKNAKHDLYNQYMTQNR